jgi:hypothetical protein
MMNQFVLFADWTDLIVPVVVFLVWIINQMVGGKKAAPQPPRPQPRPNVPPPAAGPKPAGQRGLMDEVEQFLREARRAMEQQQQKPAPKPAPPQAVRPQQPRPQQKQKQPRRPEKAAARPPQRLQQHAADRPLDDVDLGGSVARHVEQHLDTTSRFAERAGRLSHLQQQVEHDIGDHVRSKFDHQVGTLATQSATAADATAAPNPAAQIAAMLADPVSIRNAIVLHEILSPPTQRW